MPAIAVTQATFEQTLSDHPIVLVDFWAPWCAPCRAFAPVFEALSVQHPDVAFVKVNTEEEQALAAEFSIRSIPTLMLFREGVLLFAQPGSMPGKTLDELLAKARALDMNVVRAEIAREAAG